MHRILLISDGHGEDWVAAQIANHLQRLSHAPIELLALPMVGEGHTFERLGIPIALKTRVLPSGGFTFKSSRHLWLDLRAGLTSYGSHLVHSVRSMASWADLVIAVGDILPLGLAWMTGSPYLFVGCTKSDYYTPPGTSCYFLWERVLMMPPRCLHTFTRDDITCRNLRRHRVPASYWGNPMMDGLDTTESQVPNEGTFIGLLPGSRSEEAQRNLVDMLACLPTVHAQSSGPIHFEAAISTGLGLQSFHQAAQGAGWQSLSDHLLVQDGTLVHLRTGNFNAVLLQADALLAMAGTATEQAVGIGKPVVTIPGRGPQFTQRFAQLQCQLLGESVILVESELAERPQAVAKALWSVLGNSDQLRAIRRNGHERMGVPGAAHQIADYILEQLPQPVRGGPRSRS
jgi:uncharacterized protein (TIGR03492 family)